MTGQFPHNGLDPTRPWTRELTHLRTRLRKIAARAGAADVPAIQIAEEALAAGEGLLREFAAHHLENERLLRELRSEAGAWQHLFASLPTACVMTDGSGVILEANRAGAALLNLGAKRLEGRALLVFTENRTAFMTLLQQVVKDRAATGTLVIRPRERRPVRTAVSIVPAAPNDSAVWLWFLVPEIGAQAQPGALSGSAAVDEEVAALQAGGDAEGALICSRCGAAGHHASELVCVEAIDEETRVVRDRERELRMRRETLLGGAARQDAVGRRYGTAGHAGQALLGSD